MSAGRTPPEEAGEDDPLQRYRTAEEIKALRYIVVEKIRPTGVTSWIVRAVANGREMCVDEQVLESHDVIVGQSDSALIATLTAERDALIEARDQYAGMYADRVGQLNIANSELTTAQQTVASLREALGAFVDGDNADSIDTRYENARQALAITENQPTGEAIAPG